MSEEVVKPSRTKLYAIILIIIIVSVGVIWLIIPKPLPPGGITLKVITRHDTAIWNLYRNNFLPTEEAKNANITWIEFISPQAPQWVDFITNPAGAPDVAWGGGPTLFDQLHDSGLLQKLNSPRMQAIAATIPDTIAGAVMKRNDTDGDNIWIAAAISTFGFTVNTDVLSAKSLPYPKYWENLSSPAYGKTLPTATIAMGNSPGTTSNTRIYEIILQKFGWVKGWEILTRMGGNANIYKGSVETQAASEQGEVAVSMSIDFYGYTSMLQYSYCNYTIPINGSIVNGDPIAIPTSCKNQLQAEVFVEWVLTPEGQSLWLDDSVNRMPVIEEAFNTTMGQARPDLYLFYNATLANIGIEFNDTIVLTFEQSLMYYFQSVIRDAHSELVNCWHKLVDYYELDPVGNKAQFEIWAAQMAELMIITDPYTTNTEAFDIPYAQSINQLVKVDDAYRALVTLEWKNAAVQQYNALAAIIP